MHNKKLVTASFHTTSRRCFLKKAITSTLAFASAGQIGGLTFAYGSENEKATNHVPFFKTRGVILVPQDMQTWDWPNQAKKAGLSTISTHITPSQVAAFFATDQGHAFQQACRESGLEIEHELHAMSDLLPRELFKKDPSMFRMNPKGDRVASHNFCVHSKAALDIICENAVRYAKILRPTTGRYFYWIDDGQPMCACPKCRGLSDSDQALLLENRILKELRRVDPQATLAHLIYTNTMQAPSQIKPEQGIFMEFAPIHRRMDSPLSQLDAKGYKGRLHGKILEDLDANLEVFGTDGAQALEYWLDASLFAQWKRENTQKIPWNNQVFLDDLKTYASRGIQNITTFAAWIDGDYVKRFGTPPLTEYGQGLCNYKPTV